MNNSNKRLTLLSGYHGTSFEPEAQKTWGNWWAAQVSSEVTDMENDRPIVFHLENPGYISVNSSQELLGLTSAVEQKLGVDFNNFVQSVSIGEESSPVIQYLMAANFLKRKLNRATLKLVQENFLHLARANETAAIAPWLVEQSKTRSITIDWEDPPFQALLLDIQEMTFRLLAAQNFQLGKGMEALEDIAGAEQYLNSSISLRDEKHATELAGDIHGNSERYHFVPRGFLHSLSYGRSLEALNVEFNLLEQPNRPSHGRAQFEYFRIGTPSPSAAEAKWPIIRRAIEVLLLAVPMEGVRGYSRIKLSDTFQLLSESDLEEWFQAIACNTSRDHRLPIIEETLYWLLAKKHLS